MSPALGPVSLALGGHSQETAAAADREVRRLLEEADARAFAVITKRRAALDRLADRLLAQETVDRDELDELLSAPTSASRARPRAAPPVSA